ncbi:hypothetical protein Hs30E_09800 [Lactococcus hodotermopsidis]|uniref:VIT family protein n=1 Tax=Pseudolactococcus hodotermopsidis TaxID=2709157 RepID=A0A6A0BAH3_9LACT|nr:VIT family protein [Lactococcus hodotermopsidis]GFH42429.1 hypothetical protein Hs30E_09800 [Lactococcus hodotermopsidis]
MTTDFKKQSLAEKVNILRAGVLGANDGIISVAGVVIGVATATDKLWVILLSGISAVLAGAFSMAGGEYVSVSTQRDAEIAVVDHEQAQTDLVGEAFADFIREKYSVEVGQYTNPWHAAASSFISFTIGALFPMLSVVLFPSSVRVIATVLIVIVALFITGLTSARLGDSPERPAIIRNIVVGSLTMLVTFVIGKAF